VSSTSHQQQLKKGLEREEDEDLPSQQDFSGGSMFQFPLSVSTSNRTNLCSGKRKRADGRTFLTPKGSAFEEHILLPCGLVFPFVSDEDVTLDTTFGKQSANVLPAALLRIDEAELKEIALEFKVFERSEEDETALGVLCGDQLLVRQRRQHPAGPVSLRKDRWRPHKPGPTVQSSVYLS
jgi:hypothetical protein